MKASCIIVDDEPASREILGKYISDIPSLKLSGECRDAFEATAKLAETPVDLIFLDINMPRLSGISFARSLTTQPLIIFTTAYPEYAVEGFELDAVDYLVKPFSFERFLKAVNRAFERLERQKNEHDPAPSVLVRADKKIYALQLSSIAFIEGCGDYIRLALDDGRKLVVHDTIKRFTAALPEEDFIRIHKSYVLNLSFMDYIEGNMISVLDENLPVSPMYRQELISKLK